MVLSYREDKLYLVECLVVGNVRLLELLAIDRVRLDKVLDLLERLALVVKLLSLLDGLLLKKLKVPVISSDARQYM